MTTFAPIHFHLVNFDQFTQMDGHDRPNCDSFRDRRELVQMAATGRHSAHYPQLAVNCSSKAQTAARARHLLARSHPDRVACFLHLHPNPTLLTL